MEIVEELNLPPVKIHCSVLAEDAIKAAVNDYRKKNGLQELKFEESVFIKKLKVLKVKSQLSSLSFDFLLL